MAYSYNPKGTSFQKMGQVLPAKEDPIGDDKARGQRVWLLPEEVLYLVERGTLDVHWPSENGDEETGVPMSLQGAYAMFIGNERARGGKLSFERYSVYSALKRMGYTVLRAPSWDGQGQDPGPECYPPSMERTWHVGFSQPSNWLKTLWPKSTPDYSEQQKEGPLVTPGLYRNYGESNVTNALPYMIGN